MHDGSPEDSRGVRGVTWVMGLGLGERGRLWACRGSASHWVGDSRPDSYNLYSVIGCTDTHMGMFDCAQMPCAEQITMHTVEYVNEAT